MSEVNTGNFNFYRVKNDWGHVEEHWYRRWIDCATEDAVYSKWTVSHESARSKRKILQLITIDKTIFWKLFCPCCRFGTNNQYSDQIMSGFEEARSALEKVLQDDENIELASICDQASVSQHSSHNESSRESKLLSSILRNQGKEIIESTLCPRFEYHQWVK